MKCTIKIITFLLVMSSCNQSDFQSDASGAFEAIEVIVSSEASGQIKLFDVTEGDKLTAGQQVGYVDTIPLYLKKKQLEAGLRAVDIRRPDIRKQIAATEQQIVTAQAEHKRMENLVKANAGNQKQVDDWANQIKLLEKQLEAQRSALNKTRGGADADMESVIYQIMQINDQLQKCTITNPQQGIVLATYSEAGELAAPGKPLYKIADIDLLYLRAYITADQLSKLKLGQSIRVFADYGTADRREYTGILSWISDKAEFTPKGIQTADERANLVYAIKVAVKNDGYLKIGQYGELLFE